MEQWFLTRLNKGSKGNAESKGNKETQQGEHGFPRWTLHWRGQHLRCQGFEPQDSLGLNTKQKDPVPMFYPSGLVILQERLGATLEAGFPQTQAAQRTRPEAGTRLLGPRSWNGRNNRKTN